MGEGEMVIGQGTEIRQYLLGLADEECAGWVEQRLLDGSIGAEQIQLIEDELIDEYNLGGLPQRERAAFATHFLTTEDRRRRLTFSRQMIQRAQAEPLPARRPDSPAARPQLHFSWRWTAIASMAASLLLCALVAIQAVRLSSARQTQRNAESETSRLRPVGGSTQAAGAAPSPNAGPASQAARLEEPLPDLTLSPTTRDLEPTPLMPLPGHLLVRVRLLLPDLGKTPYRERLIAPSRGQLWMQEFDDVDKQAPRASDIYIPASLLAPGNSPASYRIELELPEDSACSQKPEKAPCKWYELEAYEFSVPAK